MAVLRALLRVLAGVCLCALPAAGQNAVGLPPAEAITPTLKAAGLLKDVAILREAYEQLHPGLYRYNSKAEMDEKFTALQKSLGHDQSLQEAYLAFSIFAAQVKCGHTYANFFNQPKPIVAALFKGQNRVPFYFRWMDKTMVVTEDFTPEHRLPRGTRVLSINGVPARTILERLLTVARADGSNQQKRVAYLEVSGDDTYEAFDIFFPMFFPQTRTSLRLQVELPGDTKAQSVNVEALTYEQRIAPIKSREANRKSGDEPVFEWKYLADGAAYLRMPTWALYDSKWDWKSWLDKHLDELADRNGPVLIVDLRGNEGGNDIGNEILQRLVRSDLKVAGSRRLVRYQKTPADLDPYLDTWDPSFKNWGAAAVEMEKPWPTAPPVHYFALTKYDDDGSGGDIIHPVGKPFLGEVFVLVDANNSSATFQFASAVQKNKLGTLVGEPTGGNQRGINGGAFFFLRLPNSQIEMDLPLIGTFPESPQPDGGLQPDLVVTPTLQDVESGRDAAMAKVEGLRRRGAVEY